MSTTEVGPALRQVGTSGLTVSAVGLGCNNFGMKLDADDSAAVVHASMDAGIILFDTADIYGGGRSEEYLGAALGGRRDEVVLATKFAGPTGQGPYTRGASRRYVVSACEASLRRLGTDYIDLYYQHYPDPNTPIEETLMALDDLVHAGKVRYLASSNFSAWQLAEAHHVAKELRAQHFVGTQIEWSLLAREAEREVVPACRHYGLGVLPYFPLAAGLLTGKYQRGAAYPEGSRLDALPYFARFASDSNFDKVEALQGFVAERGRSLLELAVSWLAGQPGVASVLIGATRPEQVKDNATAAGWVLGPDELDAVDGLLAST
jgi:aryl-alcohol dehydrogenase-like predicted oxidoreductase